MSTTVSHSILIAILAPLQFGGFMYYELEHKASIVILFDFFTLTHQSDSRVNTIVLIINQEVWTTDYGLRTTDYGLRAMD